jgi:hypothetical protein
VQEHWSSNFCEASLANSPVHPVRLGSGESLQLENLDLPQVTEPWKGSLGLHDWFCSV